MIIRSLPIRSLVLVLTLLLASGLYAPRSRAESTTGNGPATMQGVQHFGGTITAISSTSISVQEGRDTRTLALAQQVNVLLLDGSLGTIAQISTGMYALIYAHAAGAVPTVNAIAIVSSASPAPVATTVPRTAGTPGSSANYAVYTGSITAMTATGLTIQTDGGSRTLSFSSHVSVKLADGRSGTVDQLQAGITARVYVRIGDGGAPLIVGIVVGGGTPAASPTPGAASSSANSAVTQVTGTITALSSSGLAVQTDGGSKTFSFAPHVSIRLADGTSGTLDRLHSGVVARIYLKSSGGSSPLVVGIVVLNG